MEKCIHWFKCGDTRFEGGMNVTDGVCQWCGLEKQTRAKYTPWNASSNPESAAAYERRTRDRRLAEEMAS